MSSFRAILCLFALSGQSLCAQIGQPTQIQPNSNPSTAHTSKVTTSNPVSLVVVEPDSEKRFKLWLALQKNPSVSKLGLNEVMGLTGDALVVKKLQKLGWEDWQAHIIWSWGDMGPMEGPVQEELKRVDAYTHKHMYEYCVWPGGLVGRGGRACVMQVFACDAAKNKFDDYAWRMTIATQMHNGGAVNALRAAGASKVGEFIRNNRGCR